MKVLLFGEMAVFSRIRILALARTEEADKAKLTAYQAANLEDKNSSEKDPFLIEVRQCFPPERSESGKSEEKG